ELFSLVSDSRFRLSTSSSLRRRPSSTPAGSQGSSVHRHLVSIFSFSQMNTSTGGDGSSNKNSSSTASPKGVG
ncbi:hypothetical protein LINPERPRIM_LOCUS35447, partial [Linum perenne]